MAYESIILHQKSFVWLTQKSFGIYWFQAHNAQMKEHINGVQELLQQINGQTPAENLIDNLRQFPQIEMHQFVIEHFCAHQCDNRRLAIERNCIRNRQCAHFNVFDERFEHVVQQSNEENRVEIARECEICHDDVTAHD